jgi:subtilisin family serine protease
VRSIALFVAALWAIPCAAAPVHLPEAPRTPFTPGEVVVVAAPGTFLGAGAGATRARAAALASSLQSFGIARATRLGASAGARHELVLLASDDPRFDPRAVAAALRQEPGVIGAAPNVHLRLDAVPNDPAFSTQWHLSNSAAAIHAQQGWDREKGSPTVPIAIIDTGVDTGHEDLAGNLWTNPGEIPGNGIDDDHDGLIDDVHGWDFGDNDADPSPTPFFDTDTEIDIGWHGTFVAGLAAAQTDNATGISGVAWHCRIMPLKVTTSAGDIPLSALASAFDYAVAHGARVINLSLGTSDSSSVSVFQPLVNEAVTAGIVCVAAAGNDGTDLPSYPAACDSVLAVASTNSSNLRSSWSNWGWYVDLRAPGESMWSTIANNYVYDDWSQTMFEYLWDWDGATPYMFNDGTSFAAPVVSGAAALMRSHSPAMTPQQVMRALVISGDVKAYDDPIGPKLNLDRALTTVLAVAPGVESPGALALAVSPNPAVRSVTLRLALPAAALGRVAVHDAAGRLVRTLAEGMLGSGAQSLAWDLHDAAGGAVPPGLYFVALEAGADRVTRRIAVVR